MSEIERFLSLIGATEEEALTALLSAFGPPQPGALRSNWLKNSYFGNAAPTTAEIWGAYEAADFRCTNCGSQRRITLNHLDGNSTNHALSNLQVLCSSCNSRLKGGKSNREPAGTPHALKLYRAAIAIFDETGQFPEHHEIVRRAGVTRASGATYLLRFLQNRIGRSA